MNETIQDDFYTGIAEDIDIDNEGRVSDNEFRIRYWLFSYSKKKDKIYVWLKALYRPGILEELKSLGYYKRYDSRNNLIFIREQSNILAEVGAPIIQDVFYESCIKTQTEPIEIEIEGEKFAFTPESLHSMYLNQFHLIFHDRFLQHLETHEKHVLRDTKNASYFFFLNCIFKINKNGLKNLKYEDLDDECIWEDHITKRSFNYTTEHSDSHFPRFINNISNHNLERIIAVKSGIGYLLHHYNRATGGQVVILYDESPASKGQPEGGTGKGLFVNAIKQLRETSKIDGKKYRSDDKFKWQSVKPTTQVVWLDDVHTKFPFDDLHSNSTDGWNVERKHQQEFYLSPAESPKVVIASNTVLTTTGSTNKRRQFILEFSNHYSKHIIKGNEEPIKDEHKCTFFDDEDWDATEWNKFFSFMIDCSQCYLRDGLRTYEHENLVMNQLLQGTHEEFADWILNGNVVVDQKYHLKELFNGFKSNNFGDDSELKQATFTKWLRFYGSISGLQMEKTVSNGIQYVSFSKQQR